MWPPKYVAVASYSTVRFFFINVKLGQYLIDTVNYRQGQSSYCGGWRAAMASGCLSSLQLNLRNQSNHSPINVTCQILNACRITKERDLALHLWEGCLGHFKRRPQRALSTWAGPSRSTAWTLEPFRPATSLSQLTHSLHKTCPTRTWSAAVIRAAVSWQHCRHTPVSPTSPANRAHPYDTRGERPFCCSHIPPLALFVCCFHGNLPTQSAAYW